MIGMFQGIELRAEATRMMFWVEAKEKGLSSMLGNDTDAVAEGGNSQVFDEPDVEANDNGDDGNNEDDSDSYRSELLDGSNSDLSELGPLYEKNDRLAEIQRYPSRVLREEDELARGEGEGHSCSVCLESYRAGDEVRTMPCFHTFHTECIDPWLAERAECPECRHRAIG
jgi:hypothetical protein